LLKRIIFFSALSYTPCSSWHTLPFLWKNLKHIRCFSATNQNYKLLCCGL